MDLRLRGKRAFVSGSSSGIGAEIAKTLAEEGTSVVTHGMGAILRIDGGAATSR